MEIEPSIIKFCENRHFQYFIRCRGATRGARGEQCPGCRITGGSHKVPTSSQVLSSIQYIYSQKNLGGAKLICCPGRHLTSAYPWFADIVTEHHEITHGALLLAYRSWDFYKHRFFDRIDGSIMSAFTRFFNFSVEKMELFLFICHSFYFPAMKTSYMYFTFLQQAQHQHRKRTGVAAKNPSS